MLSLGERFNCARCGRQTKDYVDARGWCEGCETAEREQLAAENLARAQAALAAACEPKPEPKALPGVPEPKALPPAPERKPKRVK